MGFLRTRLHRNKVSNIAYALINGLLPVVLFALIVSFPVPYPALTLVLLSKWRILALRPRFWLASLKANAVDLLVGLSTVSLMYMLHTAKAPLVLELVLPIGYGVWLFYMKPRSDTNAIMAQAGIAQFLALTIIFSLSTIMSEWLVILGCWVVGYAVARHLLSNFEEELIEFISCLWGLILAQLGWLLYRWTVVFDIGLPIKLPQMALITLVVSFVVGQLYIASKTNRLTDTMVRMSAVFSAILLVIILLFSSWDVTI